VGEIRARGFECASGEINVLMIERGHTAYDRWGLPRGFFRAEIYAPITHRLVGDGLICQILSEGD
jgi:hypothetical protein